MTLYAKMAMPRFTTVLLKTNQSCGKPKVYFLIIAISKLFQCHKNTTNDRLFFFNCDFDSFINKIIGTRHYINTKKTTVLFKVI